MPFFLMPWSLVDPLSSTPGHSSSLTDHSGILLPVSFKLSAETSTACLILRLYQLVAHSGLLCEMKHCSCSLGGCPLCWNVGSWSSVRHLSGSFLQS